VGKSGRGEAEKGGEKFGGDLFPDSEEEQRKRDWEKGFLTESFGGAQERRRKKGLSSCAKTSSGGVI